MVKLHNTKFVLSLVEQYLSTSLFLYKILVVCNLLKQYIIFITSSPHQKSENFTSSQKLPKIVAMLLILIQF